MITIHIYAHAHTHAHAHAHAHTHTYTRSTKYTFRNLFSSLFPSFCREYHREISWKFWLRADGYTWSPAHQHIMSLLCGYVPRSNIFFNIYLLFIIYLFVKQKVLVIVYEETINNHHRKTAMYVQRARLSIYNIFLI